MKPMFAVVLIVAGTAGLGGAAAVPRQASSGEHPAVVAQIYREVLEFGPRPGESFIKQDFFIGGPDDDDTNKDTAVVVLIQTIEGAERMTIQVTRMEREPGNPRVKIARETKVLSVVLDGKDFRFLRSDVPARDQEPLCADILRAIRDKKALLRRPPESR